MGKSRNLTNHTYNEDTASEIAEAIKDEYVGLLNNLSARLDDEQNGRRLSLFDSE